MDAAARAERGATAPASVRAAAVGGLRAAARFPRASPVTTGYAAVLAASYLLVYQVLDDHMAASLFAAISTNLDNLRGGGLGALLALLASPLVIVARHVAVLDLLLVNGLGVLGCLGALERRYGALRAFGVYLAGHLGGTVLSAAAVAWAVAAGRYPVALRAELDYGVSYGAIAAIAALTPLVWRWLRLPWALVTLLYPLTVADWYGLLPDPTTVGHVLAATIGLAAGLRLARWRTLRPEAGSRPAAVAS